MVKNRRKSFTKRKKGKKRSKTEPKDDSFFLDSVPVKLLQAAMTINDKNAAEEAISEAESRSDEDSSGPDWDSDIDSEDEEDIEDEDEGSDTSMPGSEKRRRLAICYLFIDIHKCPPVEDWDGDQGVVKKIADALGVGRNGRNNIKRTLFQIRCCVAVNEEYTGERLFRHGLSKLILAGSFEEELIAECIEMGLSFSVTHHLVNEHRNEEGKEFVG